MYTEVTYLMILFNHSMYSIVIGNKLVDDLWCKADLCDSCMLSHDTRMRCSLVDLYYVLYGKRRPVCIPIPELAALLKPQKVDTYVESEVSIDKDSLLSVNQILFCDMHFYSVFFLFPSKSNLC